MIYKDERGKIKKMGDLINKEKLQKRTDKIVVDLKKEGFCSAEIKLILNSAIELIRYQHFTETIKQTYELKYKE